MPDYHTRFLLAASVGQDALAVFDPEGLSFLNPAGERLMDREFADLCGLAPAQVVQPAPAPLEQGDESPFLGRIMRPDGPGVLVKGLAFGLEDQRQMWVFREYISLAELGSLAAGLMHNLAGPLSVIRSSAEMMNTLLGRLAEEEPEMAERMNNWPPTLRRGGDKIIAQVDQIAATTRDLLAKISGDSRRQHQSLDLNEILRTELAFLRNDLNIKHGVEFQVNLDPALPMIKGLYSDFSQALRNVLLNAVEATLGQKERRLGVLTCRNQGWVEVCVSDNGQGIPPEVRPRIFEPFFSHGKHSEDQVGLGLHSVRQLLSYYGARYQIDSNPQGTEFTVRLPREAEAEGV
ncbi:MAG: HAMP domain-containing histidine kinase [Desulfarculaceae bacterium]|nr:HAMP domain-containing histidine kinase [Desulfarculaceae bacterium]